MPESNLNGAGWKNLFTKDFVADEDAFDYAIERCVEVVPEGFWKIKWTEEFKETIVEWFYSNNWIKED